MSSKKIKSGSKAPKKSKREKPFPFEKLKEEERYLPPLKEIEKRKERKEIGLIDIFKNLYANLKRWAWQDDEEALKGILEDEFLDLLLENEYIQKRIEKSTKTDKFKDWFIEEFVSSEFAKEMINLSESAKNEINYQLNALKEIDTEKYAGILIDDSSLEDGFFYRLVQKGNDPKKEWSQFFEEEGRDGYSILYWSFEDGKAYNIWGTEIQPYSGIGKKIIWGSRR